MLKIFHQNFFSRKRSTEQKFCHKYWQKVLAKAKEIPERDTFDFWDANLELMGLSNFYSQMGDLAHIIGRNDLAQKLKSKLTDNDMILWRGIQKPGEEFQDEKANYAKKLFDKSINLKKGDIFHMPVYSFWTDERHSAEIFASLKTAHQALIYELSLPKGSEVYQNRHFIFRRYSKFICTDNQKVIEGNTTYNHIKLELLPREN